MCFGPFYNVVLSYLVKNGMDLISVIFKLALKRYLMRMCADDCVPLSLGDNVGPAHLIT